MSKSRKSKDIVIEHLMKMVEYWKGEYEAVQEARTFVEDIPDSWTMKD